MKTVLGSCAPQPHSQQHNSYAKRKIDKYNFADFGIFQTITREQMIKHKVITPPIFLQAASCSPVKSVQSKVTLPPAFLITYCVLCDTWVIITIDHNIQDQYHF